MQPINYSIIIPHYNIPNLLMRCLNSIPVRSDIQVIVVDDCSPGADNFLSDYPLLSRPFLEYYSTKKGGSAGRARNVGLDHAKGKWLVFADADDFFEDGFVCTLDSLVDSEHDLIVFNYRSVLSEDVSVSSDRDDSHHVYLQSYPKRDTYARAYFPCPWAKMVRRSLVEDYHIRFDETRWSNDFYFSTAIGCFANTISIDNHILYVICKRQNSLTSHFCESLDENLVRAEVAVRCLNLSCSHHYILDDVEHPLIFIMGKLLKKNKRLFFTLYSQLTIEAEKVFYTQFCNNASWKRKLLMWFLRRLFYIRNRK